MNQTVDYYKPSLSARLIRRKHQGIEKIKEKSQLIKQKIVFPEVALVGAFHGTNIGDNSLGLSVSEIVKTRYKKVELQNFYEINLWPVAKRAICSGGATGVRENLVNLTQRYQSTPEKVALVGMDFASDIPDFPNEVLTFLSEVKFISCRSKRQANSLSSILGRDAMFHFDNAFSWSSLRYRANDLECRPERRLGFNTLNFFMTWARGKGFFSGSPLASWYRKQNSQLSDYIETLGLQYVKFIDKALDIYLERGWEVFHIPFTPEDDLFARTFFSEKIKYLAFSPDPKKAFSSISQCNLFLSTRYHSMIFALCSQTPCIPFLYAAKCRDLIDDLEENVSGSVDRMEIVESFNQSIDKLVYPVPYKLKSEKLDALYQNARTQILIASSSI